MNIEELEFKESTYSYEKLYEHMSCPKCEHSLDLKELLNLYGPEGLYSLADQLIKIANEDVTSSFNMEKLQ